MSALKILHVNDHYEKVGGAEVILFRTLEGLAGQGVKNVVVHQYPAAAGSTRDYPHCCIPGLGEATLQQVPSITQAFQRVVEEERPDLIHIHDIGNPEIGRISLHFAPTVQSVLNHSFYCPGQKKYLPFSGESCDRPFGMGCLAFAFLTHCNSVRPRVLLSSYHRSYQMLRRSSQLLFLTISSYQTQCLTQSRIPAERIRLLPPFTDLPDISTSQSSPFKEQMLLFTGRVIHGKGLDALLKSLKYVRFPFHLVVDGDGLALAGMKRLAAELGLTDRVTFAGWTPPEQHLRYYACASVVVVPSTWPEPFGMVGIEAMSYAKPVVAFRVGAIPEWLKDGVSGFLVPPGDLKGLAGKIDFLLQNPEAARQMGRKGRQRVEQQFTARQYIPKLLEIYRQAIESWNTPSMRSS